MVINKHKDFIDDNTIVIAHSVGVPFVLKLIESDTYNFKNLFQFQVLLKK